MERPKSGRAQNVARPASTLRATKSYEGRRRPDLRAGVETLYRDMMKDLIADAEKNIGTKVKREPDSGHTLRRMGRSRTAPFLFGGGDPSPLSKAGQASVMRPPSQSGEHERRPSVASNTSAGSKGSKSSSHLKGAGAQVVDARSKATNQELVWIARENRISLDTCKQAYDLYRPYAALDGVLTREQFAQILSQVTGRPVKDLPQGMLQQVFVICDKDKGGTIDFNEFASWYATCGFDESMTISSEERAFRDLCRKHNMSVLQVEKYKRNFDSFDADGSGNVDESEFGQLLRKCAKVRADVEIPAARFKQLWKEADSDGSGEIDFEEFLVFFNKYFDDTDGQCVGFEGFYRNVRPALGAS
eukprot:gb/GFBE01060129.1/.p1 GENE.gb/GFBE01060129.1/~~gb/GFBE01060129.1/.p1  ORF type:complete len:360 (+),score=65.15 gb/GFBE01060129.1/:1-1080(+)